MGEYHDGLADRYRGIRERLLGQPENVLKRVVALEKRIEGIRAGNADLSRRVKKLEYDVRVERSGKATRVYGTGTGPQFKRVLRIVSAAYRLKPAEIMGAARNKPIVRARQHLWTLLIDRGWGYTQVGSKCGRDHATIMHGVKMHRARAKERK